MYLYGFSNSMVQAAVSWKGGGGPAQRATCMWQVSHHGRQEMVRGGVTRWRGRGKFQCEEGVDTGYNMEGVDPSGTIHHDTTLLPWLAQIQTYHWGSIRLIPW